MNPSLLALIALLSMATVGLAFVVRRFVHVVRPDEALVLSGRSYRSADGSSVGYRICLGERVVSLPILERCDHLDLSPMIVELSLSEVWTKDAVPLALRGKAIVRITRDPQKLQQAVERLLGTDRPALTSIAEDIVAGATRRVVASVSLLDLLGDREMWLDAILREADGDCDKLGLDIDAVGVVSVADGRGILLGEAKRALEEARGKAVTAEHAFAGYRNNPTETDSPGHRVISYDRRFQPVREKKSVVVISGSPHDATGKLGNVRLVEGGKRVMPLPLLEVRDDLDLSPFEASLLVESMPTKELVPLTVKLRTLVAVSGDPADLHAHGIPNLLRRSRLQVTELAATLIQIKVAEAIGSTTVQELVFEREKVEGRLRSSCQSLGAFTLMKLELAEATDDLGVLAAVWGTRGEH